MRATTVSLPQNPWIKPKDHSDASLDGHYAAPKTIVEEPAVATPTLTAALAWMPVKPS